MKTKIILAAAFALLVSTPTFAQEIAPPCVEGTLAKYIALGAGGSWDRFADDAVVLSAAIARCARGAARAGAKTVG